jgi:hypothetical protein
LDHYILRATALAKLALDKAGPELPSLDEESFKKIAEIIGIKRRISSCGSRLAPITKNLTRRALRSHIILYLDKYIVYVNI